jgi:hypothetical protein
MEMESSMWYSGPAGCEARRLQGDFCDVFMELTTSMMQTAFLSRRLVTFLWLRFPAEADHKPVLET